MKKILSLSVLSLALIASAQAGSVSTSVPVNATVSPSCVFEGESVPLTFNYTAAGGIDDLKSGVSQTVHCNFGTIVILEDATFSFDKSNPVREGKALEVEYQIEANDFAPGGPGTQYYGSDTRNYIISATAEKDQWTVASGNYTAVVKINVDF